MTVVDLAEEAFYDRATSDAALVAELGHTADDERIIWGFERAYLGEERDDDLPVLMFHVPVEDDLWPGVGDVRMQVDLVVAQTSSAGGGLAKLKRLDGALLDRFRDAHWTYDGTRFSVAQITSRQRPPEGRQPLRRIRELMIGVG